MRGKCLTTLRDSCRQGSCVRRGHQCEDYGHRTHITSIGCRGSIKCYSEVVIESQQFNKLRGWIEILVKGQSTITLQARVVTSDYHHFGHRFTKPARTCQLRAITDTGCQSTIVNFEQVHKMGYKKSDLISTHLRMQAIDTNPIEIIGAIIIRLSWLDIEGNSHETTQICYVSNKIKGMYLNEHGCKQLGIIPESFPSVGAVNSDNDVAASSSTQPPSVRNTCSCPSRTMPLPLPTPVPLPPTDNNRGNLEDWTRDYYKSSTFNVCEHQPLPSWRDGLSASWSIQTHHISPFTHLYRFLHTGRSRSKPTWTETPRSA